MRDCSIAKDIWAYFNISDVNFFVTPLNSWIVSNLNSGKLVNGIPWCTIFDFVCWNIWLNRNNLHFNPPAIIANNRAENIALASLGVAAEYYAGKRCKLARSKKCVLPPLGKKGSGGLIRNHEGDWVGATEEIGNPSSSSHVGGGQCCS